VGGRKRTPTKVLETRGSFIAHPERKRSAEVKQVDGVGDPPSYLSDLEKQCWHELVRISLPGVLTVSDRPLVEVASRLWGEMRNPDPRAEFIGHARLGRFMVCLASMGMTPADRSKVTAAGPEPVDSPWDELRVVMGGKRA
jgi:phage terminase small subunit